MNLRYIILISAFLLPCCVYAQDTLILLTGKTKIVNVKEVNQRLLYVSYQNIKSTKKAKLKGIDLRDVYSVAFKDSTHLITFIQDSNSGLFFTSDQMEDYIRGEQFAIQNYKDPWITVGGAVAGFGGPYFLTYFYGILVPAAYVGVVGVIPAGTRSLAKKHPELYADEYFVAGYKQKAKKKNVMNAIYGGLIGIGIAGLTTGVIIMVNR